MKKQNDNLTPAQFLTVIKTEPNRNWNEYVFIILGKSGPTGKTWLKEQITKLGFKAFEITDSLYPFVGYHDSQNHYTVDESEKQVTIILNETLAQYRPKFNGSSRVRVKSWEEVGKMYGGENSEEFLGESDRLYAVIKPICGKSGEIMEELGRHYRIKFDGSSSEYKWYIDKDLLIEE